MHLLVRHQNANDEMKATLEAARVQDLASARVAAAQRKEHERRLTEVRKVMGNLAPGNRAKKLAAGLEALKSNLGELRGRLKAEMEKDSASRDILEGWRTAKRNGVSVSSTDSFFQFGVGMWVRNTLRDVLLRLPGTPITA